MRSSLLSLVVGCLVLAASAPAGADEYDDHVARATTLAQGDQHREALRAWEAAYALRQAPRLLYEIARSQQSLGMTDEAIASYGRFLVAERNGDGGSRADAEAQLARLQRLKGGTALRPTATPLDPNVRYIPVHFEMRANRPMLNAGISLLSIGYTASLVTGATLAGITGSSSSSGDKRFRVASGLLIIPILGPIISSIYFPAAGESGAGYFWSLPWMLTAAPMQVAGLVMTIVGAKMKRRVPVLPAFSEKLQISPYSTVDGGGVLVSGRF